MRFPAYLSELTKRRGPERIYTRYKDVKDCAESGAGREARRGRGQGRSPRRQHGPARLCLAAPERPRGRPESPEEASGARGQRGSAGTGGVGRAGSGAQARGAGRARPGGDTRGTGRAMPGGTGGDTRGTGRARRGRAGGTHRAVAVAAVAAAGCRARRALCAPRPPLQGFLGRFPLLLLTSAPSQGAADGGGPGPPQPAPGARRRRPLRTSVPPPKASPSPAPRVRRLPPGRASLGGRLRAPAYTAPALFISSRRGLLSEGTGTRNGLFFLLLTLRPAEIFSCFRTSVWNWEHSAEHPGEGSGQQPGLPGLEHAGLQEMLAWVILAH